MCDWRKQQRMRTLAYRLTCRLEEYVFMLILKFHRGKNDFLVKPSSQKGRNA
ncbi:Uncharacterised protein [Niallia circulans]|jgi:hypothetical protein|nr:Uncharacterised protein [Niallia circulans]